MRTLIVTEFISVDGVIEAPGGEFDFKHTGWTFDIEQDPTVYDFKLAETLEAESLLLGRTTYEVFSSAWPVRDGEFADKLNAMPKHVVSTTLTDPTWNNTYVLRSVDEIAALRDGDGGPILLAGSAALTKSLYAAGLVDRWHLMVFPVILGSGLRLFPDDAEDKSKLRLVDTTAYSNGVQLHILETVR